MTAPRNPSRRALLGAGAALIPAAVAAAAPTLAALPGGDDGELMALARSYAALLDQINVTPDDDEADALADKMEDVRDRLMDLPAMSGEGMAAKAWVAVLYGHDDADDPATTVCRQLLAQHAPALLADLEGRKAERERRWEEARPQREAAAAEAERQRAATEARKSRQPTIAELQDTVDATRNLLNFYEGKLVAAKGLGA